MHQQVIDPELAIRIVRDDPNTIAYDTETNGLEHDSYVVGYVVTNNTHSIYVPVRHDGGGNIPNVDEFESALAAGFAERSRQGFRTVGHHLGFDLRMSSKVGFGGKTVAIILGSPLEDTMINEALIDDTTLGYGLDDCAIRHGVTAKKGDALYRVLAERFGGLPDRKQMKNFWRLEGDNPEAVDYATGDGVSTLELWASQQPILDGEDLRRVWKLECDLLPYLARMYTRGVRVDMEYGARLMGDGDDSVKAMLNKVNAQFEPGFNVRSPTEVHKLYLANGFTEDQFARTDNGAPSFTEKWLSTNELGEAILSVRRIEKARDSFVKPLIETQNYGGRVFPVLHQSKGDDYGVAGARLSCSEPNLQAFPKRNEEVGKLVRPLIIPDFGKIYEDDFKQQEPRLFTHYSRDPFLIEGYRSGTMDIHDRGRDLLGLPRSTAKRLVMGMLTMMSKPTLAMHMGCSLTQASVWHAQFFEAFPAIYEFQQLAVAKFKERGYVRSILGRKARMAERKFAYRAVSRIIQNSGGDHMKTALLYLNQYEDAYPTEFQVLLSIHDSNIFQTDQQKHADEAQCLMEKVAGDFELLVPIPVDVGSGDNWSEASYGGH